MSYGSDLSPQLSDNAPSVVVIGAGISGLTAGHTIKQKLPHARLHILEAKPRAGGLIFSERDDHHITEHGPDSLVTDDAEVFEFVNEIGLMPKILPTNAGMRRLYIVINKKLKQVPAGFHMVAPKQLSNFIATDVISLRAKLRVMAEPFTPHAQPLKDESIAAYLIDRVGYEVYKTLSEPMIRGVYGADPAMLSLRAIFPQYAKLRDDKQSLLRYMFKTERAIAHAATGANYGKFISFSGGMGDLVDTLSQALKPHIRYQQAVDRLEYNTSARTWKVHLNNGESIHANALMMATPAFTASQLLREHSSTLSAELAAIPYGSMLAVSYLFKNEQLSRPLDAFGFIVPASENLHLLASTWSSVKYAGRAPLQESMLRVYLDQRPDDKENIYDYDDTKLEALARSEFNTLLPFKDEPVRKQVMRYINAMPQYTFGHTERVASIWRSLASSFPTLKLCGNAYEGVGIAASIKLARREAAALCTTLI